MSDGGGDGVGRRGFLAAFGAGLGGLGGCSAIGLERGDSGAAIEDSSQVLGHAFPYLPENYDLNPWSVRYVSGFPSLLYEYQTTARPDGSRELTGLLSDVTVEGTAATVVYSDEYTWWNGEPVTARDRWVAHRIDELLGVSTPFESFELVDERTIRYSFAEPRREELVLSAVGGDVLNTPAWLFEEWVDRLAAASSKGERESVRDALQRTVFSLEDAIELGFGSGPYELVEASPNRLMFERFEAHPNAEDVGIPRLWFPVASGNRLRELTTDGVLDLSQDDLDGESRMGSTPRHIERLDEHPSSFGTKLLFDWRVEHLRRRDVRRAIVSVLPLPLIVSNAEWGTPTEIQTGLSLAAQQRWLDDSLLESLHRYPVDTDEAVAAEFMRRAGYERSGGRWIGPDGKRAEISFLAPLWGVWSSVASTIETVLDDFGFRVDLTTYPESSFLAKARQSGFQMATWWADGTPFAAYDVSSTALHELGYGVTDAGSTTAERGRPVEPTIPAEPGSLSLAGGGRTVNLVELWRELQRPLSPARTREVVGLFARWWNYDLPDLHLATLTTSIWGNTRDFSWPESGSAAYRSAAPGNRIDYNMLRTGAISPR